MINQVKLVWITPKAEELVAYIARVTSKNQDNPEYEKLFKYLLKHKHFSPFEMVNCCVEIRTTRDIGRQILRHRSFSFQEFSQRYSDVDIDEQPEHRECRFKAETNRQSSQLPETEEQEYLADTFSLLQDEVLNLCISNYKLALEWGIATEIARVLLPEGLTPTRMYMNGTLRSWIHYWQVRCEEHTQQEHREIAEQTRTLILSELPLLKKLLEIR